jgi:hypothetical protein
MKTALYVPGPLRRARSPEDLATLLGWYAHLVERCCLRNRTAHTNVDKRSLSETEAIRTSLQMQLDSEDLDTVPPDEDGECPDGYHLEGTMCVRDPASV